MPIKYYNKKDGFDKIAKLGKDRIPFFFAISYDKSKIIVQRLNALEKIKYSFNSKKRVHPYTHKASLHKSPIDFNSYKKAFDKVIEQIKMGNTYLLNLTFKTPIEANLNLEKLFYIADAPYKLLIEDYFLSFSPESFVKIEENTISTYPMKGTIDASLPNAKEQILNNQKEMAEHVMVVDLLRNDLNIVAKETKVDKFRYITKIKAGDKELLQVSSKISAKLSDKWHEHLGVILDKLTPAGSITGTPKKKTIEIIDKIEPDKRGFYTGIFGVYDGKKLNSAVAIRAICKENNKLYYYSGGGITLDSDAKDEYNEMIDKIYIPV